MNKILLGIFVALLLTGCGASVGVSEQAQQDYAAAVKQQAVNGATAISGAVQLAQNEQAQNAAVLANVQAENAQLHAQNTALAMRLSWSENERWTAVLKGAALTFLVSVFFGVMGVIMYSLSNKSQATTQAPQVQYVQEPITAQQALTVLMAYADAPTMAVLSTLSVRPLQLQAGRI